MHAAGDAAPTTQPWGRVAFLGTVLVLWVLWGTGDLNSPSNLEEYPSFIIPVSVILPPDMLHPLSQLLGSNGAAGKGRMGFPHLERQMRAH